MAPAGDLAQRKTPPRGDGAGLMVRLGPSAKEVGRVQIESRSWGAIIVGPVTLGRRRPSLY